MVEQRRRDVAAKAPKPRAVFVGAKDGPWKLQLVAPSKIAKRIGEDVLACFLKCMVGVDRILIFEQLYRFSVERLPANSISVERNKLLLFILTASTMYELGDALQQLCSQKVVEKLKDKSGWEPLNKLRRKWNKHALVKEIRHQGGHHLGELDIYRKGLEAMLVEPELTIFAGDGKFRYEGHCAAGWDALFRGSALDQEGFEAAMRDTANAHLELPERLHAVFTEVLSSAGVDVVDERRGPVPE